MRRVIQFDVDGVLADFDLGYRTLYQELYGGEMLPRPTRWNQSGDHHVWQEIKKSHIFWANLSPLASWKELEQINRLHRKADVYFVTHRMGIHPKVQTEFWLQSWGILSPTVIVSGLKAEIAKGICATHAIDDKFGNAYMVSCHSRETKSYLLDAPYNQVDHEIVGGSVTRVKSVAEFLEEVS